MNSYNRRTPTAKGGFMIPMWMRPHLYTNPIINTNKETQEIVMQETNLICDVIRALIIAQPAHPDQLATPEGKQRYYRIARLLNLFGKYLGSDDHPDSPNILPDRNAIDDLANKLEIVNVSVRINAAEYALGYKDGLAGYSRADAVCSHGYLLGLADGHQEYTDKYGPDRTIMDIPNCKSRIFEGDFGRTLAAGDRPRKFSPAKLTRTWLRK